MADCIENCGKCEDIKCRCADCICLVGDWECSEYGKPCIDVEECGEWDR